MEGTSLGGIFSEELVTVKNAIAKFPGPPPSLSCVDRWIRTGHKGVILESCVIGGKRLTSVQAINRFVLAMQPTPIEATGPAFPRLTEEEADREMAEIRRKMRQQETEGGNGTDE